MKKFFNTKQFILFAIVVLAAFLRFWNLGTVPPSASLDEASIGYNAYSVLKTGVDEYGQFPIMSQRGYDDWRRSTYLFLTIPFVALFGLHAESIRLPAVILSILTVWAIYHITQYLFSKQSALSLNVGLFASLLTAVNPWHIYISRLGHESNAGLSFLVFGVLFFLRGVKKRKWIFVLASGIFFTLSMISYYSGQAFIPLFVGGLLVIFRQQLLSMVKSNKKILIILFLFSVFLIPVFWAVFSPQALVRFQATSTFKTEAHEEMFRTRVKFRNKAVVEHNIIGEILYNRRLFPVQVLAEGYLAHFKPDWLFSNSSDERFKAPNMGLFYMWEIPFILLGIALLLFSSLVDKKIKILIFLWFFLSPLPAAIATQTPHAMRFYNGLPVWQIFPAFGLAYILFHLKKYTVLALFTFVLLAILSLNAFYINYFIAFPKEESGLFQYSLSISIPYVVKHQSSYEYVIFSNRDNLYQSYMFYLFYTMYDPVLYQKEGGTKSGGFAQIHKFDHVAFRPIDWKKETLTNTLYVGNPSDFPSDARIVKVFNELNDTPSIVLATK